MSYCTKLFSRVCVVIILCSFIHQCFASHDPAIINILDGSKGQMKKDSQVLVTDNNFYSAALAPWINKPYYEKNIITLKINEDTSFYLPPSFTATVIFKTTFVKYRSVSDSITTIRTDTLVINYDSALTYTSRKSVVFDSAQQVLVKITKVTITGTTLTSQVLKSLILENQIQPFIDYKFSCTNNAVTSIAVDNDVNRINSTGELLVAWPNIIGADEYNLEWAYIDQNALSSGRYGNAANPNQTFVNNVFSNNATRVTTDNLSYGIPLIFPDTGTLYIRVRAVQIKSDGSHLASNWSSNNLPNGLGSYYFLGHEHGLNWQSSVTFAEDGKRKAVVQYYDGTLRSRQTVTKDNKIKITDIAETFYDYQGRPVIQVLPSPSLNQAIQYSELFNVVNTGSGDREYSKSVYDKLANPNSYCSFSAPPMDSTSGASNYYSSSNFYYNTGIEKYIPDAAGYVFTETRYTQDNTGRISAQSGVGPQFKLGSAHETKYYYASPDQDELDALFGTEVGDKSHYFKNAVQDANGQFSVSYVDMHGRTIATALAGGHGAMDTISSYYQPTTITETLSDPASTVIKDLVMENHKSLLVTNTDSFTFKYDLDPQSFTNKDCYNVPVCYNCLYDLTIIITDDCNNQKLPNGQPYTVAVQKGSLAMVNDTCNRSATAFHINFKLKLDPGTYEVTKKLSVSKYANDFYKTNVFAVKNVCTTKDQFIQQARLLLNTQCTPTYSACRDSLGTFDHFYSRYVAVTGITATMPSDTAGLYKEVWQAYNDGLKACYELGDTAALTIKDDIRREMLIDVTAPYGQYANPDSTQDIYSIFYLSGGSRPYQTVSYVDEFGNPDHVIDDNTGNLVSPQDLDYMQFARKFKESWAETLLSKHPEYCKLNALETTYAATLAWNKAFEKTDKYSDANTAGYMNPFGTTNPDPLPTGNVKNSAKNKWQSYIIQGGTTLSMNKAAALSISCPDADNACITSFFAAPINIGQLPCTGDKDNGWRVYRSMYLAAKKQAIDSALNTLSGSTCPSAATIIANHRFPHFNTAGDAVNQNGLNFFNTGTQTTEAITDSGKARMDSFYVQNCRSYAKLWFSQLKPCTAYSDAAINDIIIPRLVEVCKKGSNVDQPYGSREICPDSSKAFGLYSSFDDVINSYNASIGITTPNQFCNANVITYPAPYKQEVFYVTQPVYSKPDTCTCHRINELHVEYQAYGTAYSSFSNFLSERYNTTISEANLNTLMDLCGDSATCDHISTAINIPPLLQCGSANTCVSCTEFTNAYNSFYTLYQFTPTRTEADTASRRKNALFTSYMNTHLGISKTAWEYLDFKDKCNGYVGSKCVSCDSLQNLINSYFNSLSNGVGSRSAMLQYIASTLLNNGLTTDTSTISQALSNCQIGWEKNISFSGSFFGGRPYIFQGDTLETNLNIGPPGSKFTIEFWTNIDKTTTTPDVPILYYMQTKSAGYTDYIGHADGCYNGPKGYYIYSDLSGGKRYLFAKFIDSSSIMLLRSSDTLAQDKWYHVVITRTGDSSTQFKIYLNGIQKDNVLVSGPQKLGDGNITPIYRRSGGTKENPQGLRGLLLGYSSYTGNYSGRYLFLKNLRLYKRALDSTEIITNYSNCDGMPFSIDSLKLWAKLNEGSGAPDDYSPVQDHVDGYWLINQSSCNYTGTAPDAATIAISWTGKKGLAFASSCAHFDNALCSNPDSILLCGNTITYTPDYNQITNCSDSAFLATSAGTERYTDYTDSLSNYFDSLYHAKCLQAYKYESFTVSHTVAEYHYTLYYYDQAGNLVKTIPPQGVRPNRDVSWLAQVKTKRAAGDTITPGHLMATQYRYNSLNQLITQISPDGGTSTFYYDRLGRRVLSQNAKQVVSSNYSYTKFDALGRPIEAGQLHSTEAMDRTISRNQSQLDTWFNHADASRTEMTQTHYDVGYYVSLSPYLAPVNLRNRVTWSALYNTATDITNLNHAAATFYSYDIHGNVDTLLQDYKQGMDTSNRFKKIVYQYDLISGKVNAVAYQPLKADAFYHRYEYDADNRLTDVYTSSDSLNWEHEAYYRYYKHGPLARTVIGQQQVQGIDYAYTLQGWQKGVNSTSLSPTDDMGADGTGTGIKVPKDVFGYAIEYYGYDDYKPIYSARKMFADGYVSSNFKPLYNGNIAGISLNIQFPAASGLNATPLFYNYSYDQLNRLTQMQAFTGLNTTTNSWTPVATQDYNEKINYDPNGNIIGYLRNGTTTNGNKLGMDSLNYFYYYYTSSGTRKTYRPDAIPANARLTNQLAYIKDSVNATNYATDLDNQAANNYLYDEIGNLTKDVKGKIDTIFWNVYGKVSQIKVKDTTINYTYDPTGNRISKTVIKPASTIATFYVRDANGNVMSVYTSGDAAINSGHLTQSEVDIYGSSRLGVIKPNMDVTQSFIPHGKGDKYFTSFVRGKKNYELVDHRGNSYVTVSDKKIGITMNGTTVSYYNADVISAQDYYSFGFEMPGRTFNANKNIVGYNGKRKDNEIYGEGNFYDYGMRGLDARVGRFWGVDPLIKDYPELTPYQFASNSPIENSDLDGAESLSEIKAGLAKQMQMRIGLMNYQQIQSQNQKLITILQQPQLSPAPQYSYAEAKQREIVREQKRSDAGYNSDGTKAAWVRLAENKTWNNFANNIVFPAMTIDGVYGLYRGGASLLFRNTIRQVPYGFANAEKFAQFGSTVRSGLSKAGFNDVEPILQGSAVTGRSFSTGQPFDVGRVSDFDVALASPTMLNRAKELGIELRSGGLRTGPLMEKDLKSLGLYDLSIQLTKQTGREVNFMIYNAPVTAVDRAPSIVLPH